MDTQAKTLIEAIRYFSVEQNCIDTVAAMRWPDGKPTCPHCASQKNYWLAKQRRWKCAGCRKQYSVKVGTAFEDSALPLDKWLVALWMLCNCKNGVSSYEIARDCGVTQKSAWFMLQRLRLALQGEDGGKMDGIIEVDETFIGGKARNMHTAKRRERIQGRGTNGKTVVMGMLQRGGKVKAKVIAERDKKTLHGEILANVELGSQVMSDELLSYYGLNEYYTHGVINHAEEYVRGTVHTNGMENFWALLKRGLSGTYVAVEPFHLFRYIDEQAFRFNNRKGKTDADRFLLALSQVAGKRLTYNALTGKEAGSF